MAPQQSPPSSSVGRGGPPSSPFAGTDFTLYSPDAGRKAFSQALPTVNETIFDEGYHDLPEMFDTPYLGLTPQPHRLGVFINELEPAQNHFISRYMFVQSSPDGTREIEAGTDHEAELSKVQDRMKQYEVFETAVPIYSRGVYLRFDNLQDATAGKLILETHAFKVSYVDNYTFAIAKSQDTAAIDEFEGQIKVVVFAAGEVTGVYRQDFDMNDLRGMHEDLINVLSRFGTIHVHTHTATDLERMRFTFRVEFYSVEAANRARASLLKDRLTRLDQNGNWMWEIVEVENWTGPRAANSPHRRLPRIDDKGRFVDFKHLPTVAMPNTFPRDGITDKNNRVVREKILNGSDVRTTIMLRNIPNKMDWISLKTLLDRVCFGTYDFMYLRIDFKSGHNVGYAFINFSDVTGMLSMIDQVESRGWPGYRSSKNAELSYATIQGREALTQKFRNSSVMQQTPYCRPRLYLTYQEAQVAGNTRRTGLEVKFPEPDNWSKYQRSIASAQTVGLFPPHGAVHQAHDRTHSSAWDRGTPQDTAHNRQFGNAPANTPEQARRRAEQLFAGEYGPSQSGFVAFEHIPLRIVQELLTRDDAAYGRPNPGVIARPTGPQGLVPPPTVPMYAYPGNSFTTDGQFGGIGYTQQGENGGY